MTIEFLDHGISRWEWGCEVSNISNQYNVTIDAMMDWCEDQFGGEYYRAFNRFYFWNEDQRTLFKLRWS